VQSVSLLPRETLVELICCCECGSSSGAIGKALLVLFEAVVQFATDI